MKTINYILEGFGFKNGTDYLKSTFGYVSTSEGITISLILGALKLFVFNFLGFDLLVFTAFVVLNFLEFKTGLAASKRKGQKRESRKMGRMFLKVGTYLGIIFILNSFKKGLQFPTIFEFELDPFILFYWAFLAGVIYQLLISLLENLVALGYAEASGVLGFLVRKFNKYFEDEKTTESTE